LARPAVFLGSAISAVVPAVIVIVMARTVPPVRVARVTGVGMAVIVSPAIIAVSGMAAIPIATLIVSAVSIAMIVMAIVIMPILAVAIVVAIIVVMVVPAAMSRCGWWAAGRRTRWHRAADGRTGRRFWRRRVTARRTRGWGRRRRDRW
jgi:hypothetical protein